MAVRYEIDYSDLVELEKKIALIPGKTEVAINQVLHIEGVEIVTREITGLMRVSSRDGRTINKKHAKDSDWSKSEIENLGFTVKTKGGAAKNKGSFGYLIFPNEGRGGSNPQEQRFMQRGLDKAKPIIIERLHEKMNAILEEAF